MVRPNQDRLMPDNTANRIRERNSTPGQSLPQPAPTPDPSGEGRSGQGSESALAHLIEQEKVRSGEIDRG